MVGIDRVYDPGRKAGDAMNELKQIKPRRKRRLANPGGRPTDYRARYAEQARQLCMFGFDDDRLAEFFGVTRSTVALWKQKHAKFSDAVKGGKAVADAKVEQALFERAVGTKVKAIKVLQDEAGQPFTFEYEESLPGDVRAQEFWLKNRSPERWTDKHRMEHTGKDGGAIQVKDMPVLTDEQLRAIAAETAK